MDTDRITDDRLQVFYCDDQDHFREEFLARHGDRFEIETTDDIADVLPTLLSKGREGLPDLLLLDLYHEIDPQDGDQSDRVREAKVALEELDVSIRRAQTRVALAWRPLAVEVAEEVRRHFPAHVLPIMIYSQKGLFFLDDEQMRQIENAEIDWMLKDRLSAVTEDVRMRRVVERSRASRKMPRDVKIAVWSVAAGIAGSLLTLAAQALAS
ncbi:MAG TPA: hypothetical protein VLL27_11870 [Solirubrobacterales bacterium]|nr:hypothetical protein [Solirubrobacterales bacterium]